MACAGCKDNAGGTASGFDTVFERFWPASVPFPPMAPYLAAAVTRSEAKQWAVDIGADTDAAVLTGSTQAILSVVGRAMMDPGGTYAQQRQGHKENKKRDTRPDLPNDPVLDVPENASPDCVTHDCTGNPECNLFGPGTTCCWQECRDGTVTDCFPCSRA